MYINNVSTICEMENTHKASQNIRNETKFKEILDTEVEKKTPTIMMEDILKTKYNAKIISTYSDFSTNSIEGLNNVIIGKDTLRHMENDTAFKNKILKIIDECCSPEALEEIRSLSPPVKSAGVIIYPDGKYLCWLESIYSERSNESNRHRNDGYRGNQKEKQIVNPQIENIENELVMLGIISDSIIASNEDQNNNGVIFDTLKKKRR